MKIDKQYIILFFISQLNLFSQLSAADKPAPVARYTFNNGNDNDQVSGLPVKLVGADHTSDRFGNSNSAVYFFGNEYSYLNLGSYRQLKPVKGTISLWTKLELEVFAGSGTRTNPIILTKNSERDDFYEAYAIYYFPETKRIEACAQLDSLAPSTVYSTENFTRLDWHHLAVTYDDHNFSFYIDGKLAGNSKKIFRTVFNPLDSVILGVTANKKNNRFTNGAIDDIEFYDQILTPEEIIDLYNAPNPNRYRVLLNWCLVILGIVAFCIGLYYFIKYRIKLALMKEKQRIELAQTALETELRVNRALMNPHFVFNCLNTLQKFILKSEKTVANNYLVKFSKLMRRIMESNMSSSISLEMEIELLNRYLEIEDLRFEGNIRHTIVVDPNITPSGTMIPVMMLQPFVENAIWHGLLKKEGEKMITITFSVPEPRYLKCIIDDNGLGRKKRVKQPGENKSMATAFIEQRLVLLNRLYNLNCNLSITDKPANNGTTITILLPILNAL